MRGGGRERCTLCCEDYAFPKRFVKRTFQMHSPHRPTCSYPFVRLTKTRKYGLYSVVAVLTLPVLYQSMTDTALGLFHPNRMWLFRSSLNAYSELVHTDSKAQTLVRQTLYFSLNTSSVNMTFKSS